MLKWPQLEPGPILKDADRNSVSDGGPDASIAPIWSRSVKNPCLGWTSGTWDCGPGTRTTDHGPGTRDQDHGPRTMGQGPGTMGPWDHGTRDQGPGTRDQGPWGQDQGPRTWDHGPSRARDQARERLELITAEQPVRHFSHLGRFDTEPPNRQPVRTTGPL